MVNYEESKISIIIPVYNAEKYLERCVDSILNQTYTKLEVILVDDGSTDGSKRIIESFVERDIRVQAVFKENGGANSARKAGIMQATGKYAMFVDADDFIDCDICEKLISACIVHTAVMAGCGMKRINFDKTTSYDLMPSRIGKMTGKDAALSLIDIKAFFQVNYLPSLWGYLFDAKIIKDILYDFDESIRISEDVICLFLAFWDSKSVYILDEALYNYVMHTESTLHNHENRYYDSYKALYNYGMCEFRKREVVKELYISLEHLIIESCLIKGYAESFRHLEFLFPFGKDVKKNARIVVYGAGAFGIELVRYIKESSAYQLVGWVDRNYHLIHVSGYQIEAPINITEYQYDYVVVAVTKSSVTRQIVQALLDLSVERKKIKTIQQELISCSALPESFFERETK